MHIHKRALLLLSWLRAAFHSAANAPPLPDPGVLPAFVDNVIPSLLVYWGVLNLDHAKDDTIRQWASSGRRKAEAEDDVKPESVLPGPTLTREQAYIVRASALDACRAITVRCHQLAAEGKAPSSFQNMHEALVDGFIWTQAKIPSLRNVPRMVEKQTFAY